MGFNKTNSCCFGLMLKSELSVHNTHWTAVIPVIMSVCVCVLSRVWLFATPRTVARLASRSTGFAREEYWSGLPFPSSGDLPNPGIKPISLESVAILYHCIHRFFTTSTSSLPLGSPGTVYGPHISQLFNDLWKFADFPFGSCALWPWLSFSTSESQCA